MYDHLSSDFTCVKMRNAFVTHTHVPGSVRGRRVAAVTATLTRRERQRAATVEEIREVARGLMRVQGTTDVRFTDIAKEMGMTPPALYRYYADRDALLTDLIAEATASWVGRWPRHGSSATPTTSGVAGSRRGRPTATGRVASRSSSR